MRLDKSGLLALIIFFSALFALGFMYIRSLPTEAHVAAPQPKKNVEALFTCPGGKTIDATFSEDSVALKLSDGRSLSLPHAVSADGARYANIDESFVFWNKGNGAFILEQGTSTYDECTNMTQNLPDQNI